MLSEGEWIYLICWSVFSLITLILLFTNRKSTALYSKAYYQFLFKPWKLAVFVIGLGLIAWVGGMDSFNYAIIALLTYLTSPWAMGSLYQIKSRKRSANYLIPVIGVWLFSTSWSYDVLCLLRDSVYPVNRVEHWLITSAIYALAGTLLNVAKKTVPRI